MFAKYYSVAGGHSADERRKGGEKLGLQVGSCEFRDSRRTRPYIHVKVARRRLLLYRFIVARPARVVLRRGVRRLIAFQPQEITMLPFRPVCCRRPDSALGGLHVGMKLLTSNFSYQSFVPCNPGGAEGGGDCSANVEGPLTRQFWQAPLVRLTGDIVA